MSTDRTVVIGSSHGLHARPAKLFAQTAKESGAKVTIAKGSGASVNAASILAVIALGINQGDEVHISVDDEAGNANTIADSLAAMLESDLDEQ